MPHLTVEYSSNLQNLDILSVLQKANEMLLASGQFSEPDIKSRAIKHEQYLVGTSKGNRGFIYTKIAILSGRTPEVKKSISSQMLGILQNTCKDYKIHIQFGVEIVDMDRDYYSKAHMG